MSSSYYDNGSDYHHTRIISCHIIIISTQLMTRHVRLKTNRRREKTLTWLGKRYLVKCLKDFLKVDKNAVLKSSVKLRRTSIPIIVFLACLGHAATLTFRSISRLRKLLVSMSNKFNFRFFRFINRFRSCVMSTFRDKFVRLLPPPRRLCDTRQLFICWFVSRAGLHKKLQVDLAEIFREG